MEKSEMMKKYEQETGKQSAIVKFFVGGQALEIKSYPKLGPYDYNTEYLAWLEAKAEAYDRLMGGGKKTPKEVSDFLDLPIAQDKEGFWHAFGSPPVIDELRGTWGSLLGYEKEIPSCNIRYSGDWKDSLTMPDGWEEACSKN